MNVHMLLPRYSDVPIGGYKVLYEYANALVAYGDSVTVHHSYGVDHIGAAGRNRPSRLKRFKWMVGVARFGRRQSPRWFKLDERVKMSLTTSKYVLNIRRGDVVIASSAPTAPMAADCVRSVRGVAGIYFIQHYETWAVDEEYLTKTWRLGLKNIVIAPWLQDKGAALGVDTTLVPNAISATQFALGPPAAERPLRVLALTSNAKFKRLDLVMKVLNRVTGDPRIEAIAFGTSSARPTGLSERVRYVSRPSEADLSNLYKSARIYLCASDAEGWHLPPAEASMAGAAIVSTDIGGVRVYAGEDAFYAAIGDPDGLYDQVMRAIDDPAELDRRAHSVRDRLLAYSPTDAADRFRRELHNAQAENVEADPSVEESG